MEARLRHSATAAEPTTATAAAATAAAAATQRVHQRVQAPWSLDAAAAWHSLTAAQRKDISGLVPGLMVHAATFLLLGVNAAEQHRFWRQAELLLVVAASLLEMALVWRWPALAEPPLRTPRCILGRLAFAASPALRRTSIGMGRMLERPPLAGPLGALVDLVRLVVGTKVLTAVAQGAYAELPPLGQLLLQMVLVRLVWSPADVCATPMMDAPLSQQRLTDAAAGFETASLCLMSPWRADSRALLLLLGGSADPAHVCLAVVSCGQLLMGLLPVVLAAHYWRPGREEPPQQQRGWRRAWRRGNLLLQRWASVRPDTGAFVLRAWLVCTLLWMCCRMSAGFL